MAKQQIATVAKANEMDAEELLTQLKAADLVKPEATTKTTIDSDIIDLLKEKEATGTGKGTRKSASSAKAKSDPSKAAADIVQYLEGPELQWPEGKKFPADLERYRRGNETLVKGTTIDGVEVVLTLREAADNLARHGKHKYAIPLFSESVEKEIVKLVARLEGAPKANDIGELGMKLFPNYTAWYYNMLQVGTLIWAGESNPPGLKLSEFPHRQGIWPVTFRFRTAEVGFVTRILETFDNLAIDRGVTGSALEEYEDEFLTDFGNAVLDVAVGVEGNEVSIKDFRIKGRQGTSEQFRQVWDMIKVDQRKKSRTRGTGGRKTSQRRDSGGKRR